ncbi:calcium-binding protein [Phenylobacterium sp.]|uniref:calcium-binding protein n=1 Tax=Phenylobacterium sp. TaxID=1871053 RepID=UPI00272358D4|nr:calcium-binding protein [Phenylobacterium sp.]MDO8378336.1 calcium-binding protein [Phenylobacterium sp.]
MFLNGGSGKDKLTGGAGADTLYGLGGDDSLSGLGGEDVLAGNDGNDTLSGGANDDYLMGGLGNDRIDGGTGNDWAGYEDATSAVKVDLALTTAQNTLGAGTDQLSSIEYVYGSAYGDTLSGTSGFNYIFGGEGDDQLFGRAGDDFLAGGAGNDLIDGGANDDTVSFDDGVAGGVAVSLITQTADGHGHDNLVSIESVYGSGDNDSIVGNDVDNYLLGGDGADTIVAGGGADYVDGDLGDDFVVGGAGDDYIAGGAGIDTVSFDDGLTGGVVVSLLAGTADGHGYDHLDSIENVVGSAYADTVTGDASSNHLWGGEGDDLLSGGAGNDVLEAFYGFNTLNGGDGDDLLVGGGGDLLYGEEGNDVLRFDGGAGTLSGGAGNDFLLGGGGSESFDGGSGIDTVSYERGQGGGIFVSLELGWSTPGGESSLGEHGFDHLAGVENIIGTAYADNITGDAGNNSIIGGDGRDGLSGGSGGVDVLDGGAGDDYFNAGGSSHLTVIGGQGVDQIMFFGSDFVSTGVVVDLGATGAQQIDATHLLTMSGVETFFGTIGSDTVYASDDANKFYAFGIDKFVFRTLASLGNGADADLISRMTFVPDPNPGAPTGAIIDVSLIDADTTQAGNQAFHLLSEGSGFTGHAGEITRQWSQQVGGYIVQFDVDGDAIADARLNVVGGVSVADANFIL